MSRLPQVLIVDDDNTFHLAVKHTLKGEFECRSAYNGDEAMAVLRNHPIDVLLLDIHMRTQTEGLDYLPKLKEAEPDVAIIISSASTDFHTVKEAMKRGAVDYTTKDFEPEDLAHTIHQVLDRKKILLRNEQQNFEARQTQKKHVLVGKAPAIAELRKTIEKIRSKRFNVVITGETGTGKEVVARQLRGTLPDGSLEPFVAVDAATIQSSMAESLLFGHEKGAFTGAERTSKGIFEEANGGIIYFDEVANMPLEIQAKLLRVLQEKEVTRVGSSKIIPLEFQVICATNRNLEEMVAKGEFKGDLLQRLNVIPIDLPPLRERSEDIPLLINHFLERNAGPNANVRFSPEAVATLQNYSWPGNIRELNNLVAYLLTMSDIEEEIDVSDLPPKIRDAAARAHEHSVSLLNDESPQNSSTGFYDQVKDFEKNILDRAYRQNSGNVSKLALSLGMDRSHLYTKLKEYGIHKKGR